MQLKRWCSTGWMARTPTTSTYCIITILIKPGINHWWCILPIYTGWVQQCSSFRGVSAGGNCSKLQGNCIQAQYYLYKRKYQCWCEWNCSQRFYSKCGPPGTNLLCENNNLREGTTLHLWEAGEYPVYDENGEQVDVVFTEADSSILSKTLFTTRSVLWSLNSWVLSPLRHRPDLGLEGKTWHFDVSDFAPILKGRKRMTMEFGGQNQEEMDIRFCIIPEKHPARYWT